MPKNETVSAKDIWFLLNRPYIKVNEICEVTNLSRSTVQGVLRDEKVLKYPRWGYVTEDIIKAFELERFYQRLAAVFGDPDKLLAPAAEVLRSLA